MSKADKIDAQNKQTTVEEGTQFKGTLNSTCQVMVRGVIEGDVTAPTIIVSETGTVVGNVKAQCIQSAGVLAGRVDADDVYLSGSVRSDTVIRAKTLEVKLQSQNQKLEITFGECILDVGDDPGAEVSDSKDASPAQDKVFGQASRSNAPPAEASDSNKRNSSSDDEDNGTNHRSVPPPP
jgi:cytoskeletal protein CcmA (bactofilin family)